MKIDTNKGWTRHEGQDLKPISRKDAKERLAKMNKQDKGHRRWKFEPKKKNGKLVGYDAWFQFSKPEYINTI